RACIELGEDCDGYKDDCQCCRDNAFCSCYEFFGEKNGCGCAVGH
nr:RecName: Full=U17-ctenitoxin-Co1a; Short=U17-CNTX-Co1a; AltName: Full=Neurotoxin Oct F27-10 [Oligoctenus ornatus]